MKKIHFEFDCSPREFVILFGALDNYCSIIENTLVYLDKDNDVSSVLITLKFWCVKFGAILMDKKVSGYEEEKKNKDELL